MDFSDLPGGPYQLDGTEYTAAYVTNLVDSQVRPFFEQASYGQTTLSNTVTTQVYRMPLTAAAYATAYGYNQLYSDAEAAAATNYTLSNYDRIIVLFSYLGRFPGSSFNFAGMAHVGGVPIWINGQFTAWVVAHELGHTYGVWHAHLWNVTDNDPISDRGASLEYADPFDIMGAGGNYYPKSDFNPWFKWLLNWIHPEQIVTVTTSGIYRINRFDDSGANGTLALKIPKDSTRKYWIGYRCSLTNNASLQHGAYVIWGYNINQHSNLLDMTTPGNNTPQDAALAIGATFVDPATNLSIRPVAQGGTPPNEYLDIQVTFAPVPPLVLEQPTGQMVTPGQSAVFTVHAKGNPAPEYRWQKQARGSSLWSNLGDNATYCGAATPILIVNDTSGFMDGDQFRAVITNPLVCTNSSPAPLTVLPFGVTTLAGLAGCSRDPTDGVGRLAQFCRPQGVAVDAVGTVYVADTLNHTVRVIGSAGAVTTLAGLAGTSGSNDGTGTAAQFNWPTGVAVDASGNLYIADCSNHTIRKISPSGVVSTFAGLAGTIGASDGIGNNARFHDPSGVAVDGVGNVYVADTSNHTIRKITHTGAVSTFAGLAGVSGSTDGFGTIARFRYPQCVTTDPLGNVYVADLGNQTVRKITPSAMVSTWAGMAGIQGCADGMGTAAQFFDPASVAVDGAGNVYVADTGNHIIRKITPAGMVTTWAGLAGNSGSTDGTPSEARFYSPYGVAADLWGRVYVADSFNHTLRKIVPAPVPQLVAASMSNGVFQCHLNGLVGSTYVIQVSSDLVNWLAFSTSTIPAEGTVRFVDATMGNQPRRFYRALPLVSESITFPATSATIASPLIVSNGCILQIKDKRF